MKIPFLKLHGLGNDFVLIDERRGEVVPETSKAEFAKRHCERHTGVGADGVLFIGEADDGISFRVFNADGSEAEMCVNGIRCVALALRLRLAPELGDSVQISTPGGVVTTRVLSLDGELGGRVEVQTFFDPKYLGSKQLRAGGEEFEYHLVNVGNPHAVAFVDPEVSGLDVEGIGHEMEFHQEFAPHGTNTEFVNLLGPGRLRMRVHERGACETMACGSGAIAAATAAHHLNREQDAWAIEMRGGTLEIVLAERTVVRGQAALVFEGNFFL